MGLFFLSAPFFTAGAPQNETQKNAASTKVNLPTIKADPEGTEKNSLK